MSRSRYSVIATNFGLLIICLFSAALPALADVRLPHIIGNNMVLQRNMPVPIWGWAGPGEEIKVKLGQGPPFCEKSAKWQPQHSATTRADIQGKWMVHLPAMKAGGPYQMIIK